MAEMPVDEGRLVFSPEICLDYSVTDRALRKWVATGRFPVPDGNLHGRNFWFARTVRAHKAEVVAGRFRQVRRPLRPTTPEAA